MISNQISIISKQKKNCMDSTSIGNYKIKYPFNTLDSASSLEFTGQTWKQHVRVYYNCLYSFLKYGLQITHNSTIVNDSPEYL